MSKKRDYIEEILEKKQRKEFESYTSLFTLFSLKGNFEKLHETKALRETTASLFLVGIVSCLEVDVRRAAQRLIDAGSPYVERIDRFKDHLKVDLPTITRALHDKKISLGDLVSHLLPFKNLGSIENALGNLLDVDFRTRIGELREFVEPPLDDSAELNVVEGPLLLSDTKATWAALAEIFRRRNETAHEAEFLNVSVDELAQYFQVSLAFLYALDELVDQTLYPNHPRTAFGIAKLKTDEAAQVRGQVDELYESLLIKLLGAYSVDVVNKFKASHAVFHSR